MKANQAGQRGQERNNDFKNSWANSVGTIQSENGEEGIIEENTKTKK
jgi:hypothetical protein